MKTKKISKKTSKTATKGAAKAKKTVSAKDKRVKPAAKAIPAAKAKPVKKEEASKPEKKKPVHKSIVITKTRVPLREPQDPQKAVDLAVSIAQLMKRGGVAAKADSSAAESEVRLARRPTTRTQGKESAQFPAADLKEFRKRLIAARDAATRGVDAMKATGFNEAEDHEADGGDGTNQTLRLQALGQMGNINRTLQQIEEALHRIDDGTYGVCSICGKLIRKPRLLNQPFVHTCMECQSAMERGEV